MDADWITVGLLSVWLGFAVALQVRTQIAADADLTARGAGARHIAARLIYFVVGIAGMLGLAALIGSVQAFRGAAFPLGFGVGVAAFVVATRLAAGKRR
jgi:uncharacterized membrane protein YuzA (DUF378 family)